LLEFRENRHVLGAAGDERLERVRCAQRLLHVRHCPGLVILADGAPRLIRFLQHDGSLMGSAGPGALAGLLAGDSAALLTLAHVLLRVGVGCVGILRHGRGRELGERHRECHSDNSEHGYLL
jgi:hypothetical protein